MDRMLVDSLGIGEPSQRVGTQRSPVPLEDKLWLIAFGCAVFLLLGMLSDRTSITYGKRGNTVVTDAAGYNMAATFSGIVALAGLTVLLRARSRVAVPVLGALVATAAFALTVYASGIALLARLQGKIYFYGIGDVLEQEVYGPRAKVHAAVGPPFFATAAFVGAVAALTLAVMWLNETRRGRAALDGVARAGLAIPIESVLHLIALGCAFFLVPAMLLPDWFARTWWSTGTRNRGGSIYDSPAGYVGMMSLCGLVAFVALIIALWRWPRAAVTASAGAFAVASYVIGSYWLDLSRGIVGLEGHRNAIPNPRETIHWPTAMPLFAACAVIGVMATLTLLIVWLWQARRRWPLPFAAA